MSGDICSSQEPAAQSAGPIREFFRAKSGSWIGGADCPDEKRVCFGSVSAKNFGAQDLWQSVKPFDAGPHSFAACRRFGGLVCVANRIDDLGVPGAATQNAADGILCLLPRGMGGLCQKRCRGHEHAGRADAALRSAMAQKGTLEVVGIQAFDSCDF